MALCTGLYIATVWDRFGHSLVTFILLLLLAAQLVFMNPTVRLIPGFISHGTLLYDLEVARLNLQDELDQLNDVVKNTKGLILIDEYMALLPLQDRNIFFQPFEMTQLTRDGLWDETFFVNQIEEQTFSLIVIFSGWGEVMIRERWSDSVLEAIDEHYVLTDEIAATRLFIPRQSG
jgi:hypothetical protein